MTVPSRVRVHEPFKVQAVVYSNASARAHLAIMRNGALLHESAVELSAGANVIQLYTGLLYRGPVLLDEILEAIRSAR